MTEKSRYWSPNRTFDIIVKIGKIDISPDLVDFKVITSIKLPYQTFVLKLFLDPRDIIIDKIYGQTPIKITINLLGTDQVPMETTEFELMYLSSDMDLNKMSETLTEVDKKRTIISITAVSRQAYKTMNTYVNSIYQGKKIKDIITDLISNIGAKSQYDNNGQNAKRIDQVLIPPSTLYKNLQYINRTFGIFEGLSAIYCSYDNIVHIKNLTNKMLQAQTFTIYQLSVGVDNKKVIDRCDDGKHYYTIRDIGTKFEGNSVFAFLAPNITHIVKPRDRLSYKINTNLEAFTKKYGIASNKDQIFFDKQLFNDNFRNSTYIHDTGYELEKTFINANLSKQISDITELSIIVERNIKILNLMNVGESVEVTTQDTETSQIGGRYILKTSELRFNKIKDWEASAVISIVRSNRMLI